jgi:hypothetical protein
MKRKKQSVDAEQKQIMKTTSKSLILSHLARLDDQLQRKDAYIALVQARIEMLKAIALLPVNTLNRKINNL